MKLLLYIVCFVNTSYVIAQKNLHISNENELAKPEFTVKGGFYQQPISVELKSTKGAKIYYTTNGLTPSANSNVYTKPIRIDSITTLSAVAINNESLTSGVAFQSYFISRKHSFPIVSIITDHVKEIINTDPLKNTNNKKVIGVSYYDENKKEVFKTIAEMKLTGRSTRNYPQKSFAIHFRGNLGIKYIDYQLFPEKPQRKYYSFKLRNSGNDWSHTFFKDAMMHRLISNNTYMDYQGYKPVILYVNGRYEGIINLREEVCSHYIQTNYGIDNDGIDLIQFSSFPTKGDMNHWNHMIDFIKNNNLTIQSKYDSVLKWIDVNNFIDYQVTEIFYANTDWPMSNIKYWRPAHDNGKWRWIFYDADEAFNTNKRRVKGHHNTLSYAMGNNNCHMPHLTPTLTEATVMLRSLMNNRSFKEQFLMRFMDLLNSNFQSTTMCDTINNMKDHLTLEMPNHINRWSSQGGISSMKKWDEEIGKMLQFAKERNDTMLFFLAKEFNLNNLHQLTIKVEGRGEVQLNSIDNVGKIFKGNYFEDFPVQLTAIPDRGKKFIGWNGIKEKNESLSLEIILKQDTEITAIFE